MTIRMIQVLVSVDGASEGRCDDGCPYLQRKVLLTSSLPSGCAIFGVLEVDKVGGYALRTDACLGAEEDRKRAGGGLPNPAPHNGRKGAGRPTGRVALAPWSPAKRLLDALGKQPHVSTKELARLVYGKNTSLEMTRMTSLLAAQRRAGRVQRVAVGRWAAVPGGPQ